MAELLVRVVDKVNSTSQVLDSRCTKRGDVIVVMEDGWPWGNEELGVNSNYVVLKLPNASRAGLRLLEFPEGTLSPLDQRRGRKVEIASFPPLLAALFDNPGGEATANYNDVAFLALTSIKPPINDQAIIA